MQANTSIRIKDFDYKHLGQILEVYTSIGFLSALSPDELSLEKIKESLNDLPRRFEINPSKMEKGRKIILTGKYSGNHNYSFVDVDLSELNDSSEEFNLRTTFRYKISITLTKYTSK